MAKLVIPARVIAAARVMTGLSQEALAAELGIAREYLSRVESDRQKLGARNVERLRRTLLARHVEIVVDGMGVAYAVRFVRGELGTE